uniref:HMG box domain-containing protein n=1 Tax=Glossina pallidipes TaxID=7398 RepID=A0A1B0AGB7_GLOPL
MAGNKSACGTHSDDERSAQPSQTSSYKKSTAPTPFFVFLYEFRQILKLDSTDKLRQVDISKMAGKKWRKMCECQKKPYKMAENNKRIKLECDVKCERKSSSASPSQQKEIYQNSTARTSFFVFLYEYRQRLKRSCKKVRQSDICRRAGKRWRGMSDCEKQPYIIWAQKNRKLARCASKPKTEDSKGDNWVTKFLKRECCA